MPTPVTALCRLTALCTLLLSTAVLADHTLLCTQTKVAPTIDGKADDVAWQGSAETTVRDAKANLKHNIACVYDESRIYIKSRYSDSSESRTHKTGVWSEEAGLYTYDTDREDTLVLKWNMLDNKGDISLTSDTAYKADVWFWKAFRTDPAGYADDKNHIYSNESSVKAKKRISKKGHQFFLVRRGDKGTPSYKPIIHVVKYDDRVNSYSHREPTESRADVQAKGHWSNNQWTVEFARDLNTGNPDDVYFNINRSYQFGVSRYEIAGTPPMKVSNNPMHGAGDIEETIILTFTVPLAAQK